MSAPAVLIVEDESIVAMDLQATLQELGYDAFAIASSAEEAIAAASVRCPDLVLMDIRIKGKRDGIETAEILRTRFTLPVVYLTSHADDRTIERAKVTEPYGYLQKPVRGAELRSAIEVALYKYEMEKQTRHRQRWFETTLKSIADAVVAVDTDGKVAFMNETAADLTGVGRNVAVGMNVRDVMRLRGTSDLPVMEALHTRSRVELPRGVLENMTDGSSRSISDSAAPVLDDDHLLGAVMVFRDVTDAERMQRRVELSDRMTSLGTLAAGVAHEINNPLGAVIANAQYVGRQLASLGPSEPIEPDDLSSFQEAIADIESAGARIASIVSDLRVFSQPDTTLSNTADIGRCVDWATRTTRHELLQRARLVVEPIRVGAVRGDETRVGQVLINLIVNAAHAIVPGHVDDNQVRVSAHEDGDEVVVSVGDTGSGMTEDVRRQIFDPFFTTKAVGIGTGLGLSICHGIVTALGGRIELESVLGQGTTVRVCLPKAEPSASRPKESTAAASDKRLRVMVIDDEPLVLRTVERVLRKHEVVACDCAEEAIDRLENDSAFDVIICDVTMPSMTGIEFYQHLLQHRPDLAQRILFLSGGAITQEISDFLNAHELRQVQKPFDVDKLLEALEAI